jgi:hypothetical protein
MIDKFWINFSDLPDRKIWDHESVRCIPLEDDKDGFSGKWYSNSNHDDVFGPGTGNWGWYTWQGKPKQIKIFFLSKPGANNKGLENSLIRFYEVTSIERPGMGDGMGYDEKGERIKVKWELVLYTS